MIPESAKLVIGPLIAKEIEDCRIQCSRFEPHRQEIQHCKKTHQAFDAAISVAEQVISQSCPSTVKSRCFVLEIYANDHSPLTEMVNARGLKAVRFTRADGDLATPKGRQMLWQLIDKLQPEHIFVAPECGPWGGWNRLNASKSLRLWDKIHDQQESERSHVRLCAQLCEYQGRRGRHFHIEQPVGSAMVNLPEFVPIKKYAQQATFDMCSFGLKIPGTSRFIKKRTQIWTSCLNVLKFLHQHNCPNDHDHHVIAGSVRINGETTRLSKFCATYCRGFARALARVLHECPVDHQIFALEDEPPSKKPRLDPNISKRARITVDPDLTGQGVSSTGSSPSIAGVIVPDESLWHEAFRMANLQTPRVGNAKFDTSTDLATLVQGIYQDGFQVHCLFSCRGTDRLQIPLNAPPSQESPWRHVLSIHRESGKLHDLGHQRWHSLTRIQRIAKSIPSRLTLTIFGS